MNHRYRIIIYAVLTMLMMVFISYSGTIAQGLKTSDRAELPPDAAPGSKSLQGSQEGEAPAPAPEDTASLVSSSFTYQGLLKNGGAAVNARCDFTWNIFADASGGTSLATDTDTNIQLTNGLFTVAINVPVSLMDGNARYVEIQVRCPTGTGAYTTLSPRQELQAAPYALGLRLPFSHTINSNTAPLFAITNTGGTDISPSVLGSSFGGDGVQGKSTGAGSADNGVYGETNSTSSADAAIKGVSTDAAAGGYFTGQGSYGVYGTTNSAVGFGGYFNNSAIATSGAALYANGDAKQALAADGFVKAGVYLHCFDTGSTIDRYFNNVNITPITVIDGSGAGRCTVDFGFNVRDNRYVVATAYGGGVARIVTFDPGTTLNRLDFFRFDQDGVGSDGTIMVLIY